VKNCKHTKTHYETGRGMYGLYYGQSDQHTWKVCDECGQSLRVKIKKEMPEWKIKLIFFIDLVILAAFVIASLAPPIVCWLMGCMSVFDAAIIIIPIAIGWLIMFGIIKIISNPRCF